MERRFTVDEANRTLPLVRRIVEDIVETYRRWSEARSAYELVAGGRRDGEWNPRAEELERTMDGLAREIEAFVRELNALGVEFKGFDYGLVDFPGEIAGRPVYLCWRLGEPAVQFWHERDAGFAGRQPLSPQPAS